jgi:hypothetical protein
MQSHLITFAANSNNKFPEIYKASNRLHLQAKKSNLFDTIIEYTEKDLQSDNYFWPKHKEFIKNNPKGFGWWFWKPYIIKKRLEQIPEGDVLTYLDCGCEIIPKCFDQKNIFISEIQSLQLQAYSQNIETHCKHFTKQICYNFFNTTESKLISNGFYYEANRIFLLKNNLTKNIIDEWWSVLDSHYELYDNNKTDIPENNTFYETRGDQTIFNFILFKNNLLNAKTQRRSQVNVKFEAWRNKTGQSKLCTETCSCGCCVV